MYLDHRVARALHEERLGRNRPVRAEILLGSPVVRPASDLRPSCPRCGRSEPLAL